MHMSHKLYIYVSQDTKKKRLVHLLHPDMTTRKKKRGAAEKKPQPIIETRKQKKTIKGSTTIKSY